MTLAELTTFFGWMTVLNFALLALATLGITAMRPMVAPLHQRLFAMDEQDINKAYFNWLAFNKALTLVFALTPYLALKLM